MRRAGVTVDIALSLSLINRLDKTESTLFIFFYFGSLALDGSIFTRMSLFHRFQKLQQLKVSNPHLRTLIAVGGWNAASTEFTKMVATKQNRQKFIESSITFLRKYGFNGLDFDWEYPAQRGGKPEDKPNFARLVKVS